MGQCYRWYIGMYLRIITHFLALLSCCSTWAADYLFRNGSSQYTIVLPAEASKSEITAAREFQKYVKETSGAILSIANGTDPSGKRIFIG